MSNPSPAQATPSKRPLVAGLIIIGLVYAVFGLPPIDQTYVDFGDGNYMYISSRLADGVVLYRDIVSPQPPLHLYSGSLVVRLCRLTGIEPLLGLRVYQLLLRLTVALITAAITWRLFRCRLATLIAFFVYLILPIGFWWTRGYQSEPLELVPLTLCFWLLLDSPDRQAGPLRAALAGVCASLALATNMTFLPYLCFHILYLVLARRRLLLPFLLPFAVVTGAGVAFFSALAGPAFLENVWSNQVGTFPPGRFVWLERITRDLGETLQVEGGFVLAACAGLWLYTSRSKSPQRHYVIWYAVSSMGSIVFTAKGGTRNYIFSLGEPMVAVFAAHALREALAIGRKVLAPGDESVKPGFPSIFSRFTAALVLFSGLVSLSLTGLLFVKSTWEGRQYELEAARVLPVMQTVALHTDPGDTILAPPFYAFVTDRVIAEECCSTYINAMRYFAEIQALWSSTYPNSPMPVYAEAERRLYGNMQEQRVQDSYPAIKQFMSIRKSIEDRSLGIVLLNISRNNLFGNLWILRSALADNYTLTPAILTPTERPEGNTPYIQCRNEQLVAYIPNN